MGLINKAEETELLFEIQTFPDRGAYALEKDNFLSNCTSRMLIFQYLFPRTLKNM